MEKKDTKRIIVFLIVVLAILSLLSIAFVYGHKPDVVKNKCFRTTNRADGKPKIAFDTPQAANLQSLKQFLLHGEFCNPYESDGKYYTGHSNKALIRSINPFGKKV